MDEEIDEVMELVNLLSAEAFNEGFNIAKGKQEDAMECFYRRKKTKSLIGRKLRQLLGDKHG